MTIVIVWYVMASSARQDDNMYKWVIFPFGNPITVYATKEECEKVRPTTEVIDGMRSRFTCKSMQLDVNLLKPLLNELNK